MKREWTSAGVRMPSVDMIRGTVAKRALFLFGLLCAFDSLLNAQQVSWTPSFENVGLEVVMGIPTSDSARIEVQVKGQELNVEFNRVHSLSRISETRFAGSIFDLTPGALYEVRLESSLFPEPLSLSVHTRADLRPTAQGSTYHVSPLTGADSNSGHSQEAAFATLGRALSVVQAGSKVVLYDGVYREGDLLAPRSGTSSSPIVIENAPGATPVIDGTDPSFTPVWELFDSDNHVYRSPCTSQPDKAYLDGGHWFRYRSLDGLRNLWWSQPGGFFVDGTHLYARFPNDGEPSSHTVSLPRFTTALTFGQVSHWQLRGLVFQYFGFGAFHRGIYLDGADHIVIDGCTFRNNVIGVGLKRSADFNVIQNCEFSDTPMNTWNWHAVKSGGVGYEGGGVYVYTSNIANRGNVIRNNRFADMFDGAHLFSSHEDGPTRDLDFYGNTVEDCLDDAVETDGGGINCRIYRNRFRSFLTGVSVAPAFLGPTYIMRNMLYDWHSVAEFTGYPIKWNHGESEQTQFVYLYHNTCYTAVAGQDGFLFKNFSNWANVVSRNNVYAGTDYAFESQSASNPIDFDFDALFTSHPTRFARWLGQDHSDLDAFRQASGQEGNGFSGPLGFVDASSGDFRLDASSDLVDAGVRIPGVNDAYSGGAPDMGANER